MRASLIRKAAQYLAISVLLAASVLGQGPSEPVWTGVAMPYYTHYGQSPSQPTPPTGSQPSATNPYDLWFPTQFISAPINDELGCTYIEYAPPYWFSGGQEEKGTIEKTTPSVNTVFITPQSQGQQIRGFEFLGSYQSELNSMPGSQDAVFYSNQPCYSGTTEYGFTHVFNVQNGTVFYYGQYQNCPPNTCYNQSSDTGTADVACSSGFTMTALPPSKEYNSKTGAYNYFYGAYIFLDTTDEKYKFYVQVLDPQTDKSYLSCTIDPSASNPFALCSNTYTQNECTNFPTSSLYYAYGAVTAAVARYNDGTGSPNQLALELQGFYVGK